MSMTANQTEYLSDLCDELAKRWPDNRTVNIVCHGHSVPSGYRCTPFVDQFNSYPFLLLKHIKERFPYAVVNVIVTAIGGENSKQGAERFVDDVLCHKPDLITIDYSLNDRQISLREAESAWRYMIETALEKKTKVILLTPSWEQSALAGNEDWALVAEHAEQVRRLSSEYQVGLADTFREFERYVNSGGGIPDLLSHVNHPSNLGHQIIAQNLARWFLAR